MYTCKYVRANEWYVYLTVRKKVRYIKEYCCMTHFSLGQLFAVVKQFLSDLLIDIQHHCFWRKLTQASSSNILSRSPPWITAAWRTFLESLSLRLIFAPRRINAFIVLQPLRNAAKWRGERRSLSKTFTEAP